MGDIYLPKNQFYKKYYEGGDSDNPIIGMVVEYSDFKNKQSGYDGPESKFSYKVRLCTGNSESTSDDQVITVSPPVTSSGRGSLHSGNTILARGDFVRLVKNKRTKQWSIVGIVPVCAATDLSENAREGICEARTSWSFRDGRFQVPLANQGENGGSPINDVAPPEVPDKAKWDKLYLNIPTIELKSACEPSSMAGMPSQLSNLMRDVQDLRTGLLGDDSFLVTSREFVDEVQGKVDATASMVTGVMSWLIQEIKKQILRQVNFVVNTTVGNAYLNTRYQLFEGVDQGLSAICCAFAAILDALAQFVADAINNFLNDVINPVACAIENFLADLLSQIANGILNAISGILSGIGSIIGAAIGAIDAVLGVVESLLNIFEGCPPQQVCPADDEWNFLDGVGGSGGVSLDIQGIFDRVNSSISAFSSVGDAITSFPASFSGFDFGLTASSGIAAAGGCFVGPVPCGPPTVSFFGGGATSSASGLPIISPSGGVIGITLTSSGFGYTSPPMVVISDPCGLGAGAIAVAGIGPVTVVGPPGGGGLSPYLTGPSGSPPSTPTPTTTTVTTATPTTATATTPTSTLVPTPTTPTSTLVPTPTTPTSTSTTTPTTTPTPTSTSTTTPTSTSTTTPTSTSTTTPTTTPTSTSTTTPTTPTSTSTTTPTTTPTTPTSTSTTTPTPTTPTTPTPTSTSTTTPTSTSTATPTTPAIAPVTSPVPTPTSTGTPTTAPVISPVPTPTSTSTTTPTSTSTTTPTTTPTSTSTTTPTTPTSTTPVTLSSVSPVPSGTLASGGSYGTLRAGGSGGVPVTVGGVGGAPVTAGGLPVTAGAVGGSPLTAGGSRVTGSDVTVGGAGGTQLRANATGGTPVTAGGLPVVAGGSGGTPVVVSSISPPSTSPSGIIVDCRYPTTVGYNGPGVYLDLTSVSSSSVNVTFTVSSGSAAGYTIIIPEVGTFDASSSGVSYNLSGGRIYGPCSFSSGQLYVGDHFLPSVPGSGTLPFTSIVIEDGGDDWDDFVVTTARGRFVELIDCTPSTTSVGITSITILSTGFGYLPAPDGTRGANGRTYGDRCQTLVQRAVGTWDQPYNPGETITLETGDRISLPGMGEIQLGDSTTLPRQLRAIGAYVVRVNPPLATSAFRSMVGFNDSSGTVSTAIRSMVGFDVTLYGLGGFGLLDLEAARRQGYSDADVRYFLENDHSGAIGPRMRALLADPNWGRLPPAAISTAGGGWFSMEDYNEARRQGFTDPEIRFYLEKNYIGRISPRVETLLNDPTWGRDVRSFTPRSMVGFDDSAGAETRPNQFGYLNDYPRARAQGFTDYDIRYYLENVYTGAIGVEMRRRLNDPSWGRLPNPGYTGIRQMFGFDDSSGSARNGRNHFGYITDYQEARRRGYSDADIRYYLENHYTGELGPRMREALNDPNFGRIQGISNMAGVPFGTPRDMSGFSDAYGTSAGVFGNADYEEARRQGYSDNDIRNYLENVYTGVVGARIRTRLNDPSWGAYPVDRGFSDVPGDPGAFGLLDLEQALRQNTNDNAQLAAGGGYASSIYVEAIQIGYTEADVRYYLENYYRGTIGPAMQARLDDPTWGRELPVIPGTVTSAPSRIRSMVGFSDRPGRRDEFSTADLDEARRRGFRDVDVRFYLENNYNGFIAEPIRRLLSDPNWGRLGQTITVSLSAPGCPDDVIIEDFVATDTPVVASIAGAVIADPGFRYDCANDTIEVVPPNGAQLEYECVNGSISEVRVVNPGSGFVELPEIRINSNTGYNARIIPVLGFNRINTDAIGDIINTDAIGAGVTFIRVIDCVGTIPPVTQLDIVPE